MKLQNLVVKIGRRICQGLTNIIFLKLWVFGRELLTIRISGKCFQHATNCQSHATDARMAIHFGRIARDATKPNHRVIPLMN